MLVAEDTVDTFHKWDQDNPNWIETFWYGAWIPEAATTIYIYQWFRPVLGIYGGGCFVWNADAYLPWDIPVFRYDVNRALTAPADLRNLVLDNGASLRSVAEGQAYEIGFKRADVDIKLRFDATSPAKVENADQMTEFFSGHIDQSGRYTGTMKLKGADYAIDCFGIRDRSWGPRVITDDIRLNYCHGQSEDLAFVSYSKIDGAIEKVFRGHLVLNGKRIDIASGQRTSHFKNAILQSIDIELTGVDGSRISGRGVPLNRMVYESYPGLLNWLYLMEWRIGTSVIYGEEQDVWSLPLWHNRPENRRS